MNITKFFGEILFNPSSVGEYLCNPAKSYQHDFVFQTAHVLIFLSFLSPLGINGTLYLRGLISAGYLIFAYWSYTNVCAFDLSLWNLLFSLINIIYFFITLIQLHLFLKFPREVELVYRDLFHPLLVSRYSFNKLFRCKREILTLSPHDTYCYENKTLCDKLALLLSGRLAVLKNGQTLHLIDSHQFVDSPEWFGSSCSDTYQVTVVALEECHLIVWHRDKLKLIISTDHYMQRVLDNVLGKDVVKKLLFVTDTIGNNRGNEQTASETSKLILPASRAMDQVIKREIYADKSGPQCFWTMSGVKEELETKV